MLTTLLPQALLEHIMENEQLTPKSSGEKQHFLRIDCRSGGTTNPAAFVQQLQWQNDSQDIKVGDKNIFTALWEKVEEVEVAGMLNLLGDEASRAPLDTMTELFNNWLEKYPGKRSPVIIIGEARVVGPL